MCCAGLGPWHTSDFDDELVSVSTKHGHRQAHGSLVAIKCGARIFHHGHPAIWRQREEVHFARIRRAHGNPVPVADLADADRILQVPDRSFVNVASLAELLGAAVREFARVERRLQGPGLPVDVSFAVPADDLGANQYPQAGGDFVRRCLDLDLDLADGRLPVGLLHF